ncbi:MAG: TonB-dependent siderophore receptor [Hydrocarboniphaga sp.]|uniref:TonB-dependent siderophore receptor n=1 Tax=Hydrocarboniphaga sp. TaxID=2033016 RepID=UPI00262223C9|nr:TonB-dependent siderophore receptor [Hydrocarboniphaga sp.]MDB5969605.1 TonB-dependent siderophore receptor [Hydrocarboniphaga sp.]
MPAAALRHPLSPPVFFCRTLLVLCISCSAQAQDQSPADKAVVLDTVTVTEAADKAYTVDGSASATKLPLSLRDTPQSVTVVTRQRMDDQNLQSMRDVLDNTTGVYSYAYDSERVVFTSRGFIIDNTLYDGVPVAPGLNAGSTDATLDTALYERIEIVRGATGLMTGAGNPSAAVNLVRKHADSEIFIGSASLSYGSWDDFRSTADISTPLSSDGKIRARVVGVYQNRDSYMDLYKNEKQVFYGIVDADLSPNTRLSVGYDYQQTLPQGNTWGSFPLFFSDGTRTDWPRSVTTATDWSYWNNKTQTAFAELNHQFGNGWSLRSTVSRRATDGNANLFYVFGFPDKQTGEGLYPYAYRSDDHGRQNSVDAYLSGPFELFGRKHELVVGGMGSWLHVDSYEYQPGDLADVGNFYEWDGSYPEPEFASEGDYIARVRTRQSAAYTALRLSLADPLKLIAGARYSTWKSSDYYVYDGPDAAEQDYRRVTPYAGLIYDLNKTYSAFASYTKIFNPQKYQRQDGSYLDPLDGYSTEIGIKGEHFGGRLNTALTLFDTRQDNVAVTDFGEDVNDDPMRQAYLEADGTRTRGFELEANGEVLKDWNLSLGWSHYTMQDTDGATVKGYIPRTMVRAFTTWTLPGALHELSIGGGLNWQSDNYVTVESSLAGDTAQVKQGSFIQASLMARYQITPHLSAQLNGNNLLDKKYYVVDEYGNLYYGEPASAMATLRYDF